ncbi:MAG: cbb3-type cytochrome c oxidase subunit I [Hyphomonas sp.]
MSETFFDPNGGGDPVMFQHILWFLGHPEVYVSLILLCGAVFFLLLLTLKFFKRKAFGRLALLWGSVFILVGAAWVMVLRAQAAFVQGIAPPREGPEAGWVLYPPLDEPMAEPSLLDGVLSGTGFYGAMLLVVAGSVAAWAFKTRGKQSAPSAVTLFLVAAAALAIAGSILGVRLNDTSIDRAFHDTYYVVAHFRYFAMLVGITLVFAGVYWLLPKVFAVRLRRGLALIHWVGWISGVGLIILPQLFLSTQGMPRRYSQMEQSGNMINAFSSAGYIVTLISLAVFAICLLEAVYRRVRHGRDIGPTV